MIPIEKLIDDAWNWWSTLQSFEQEDIVLKLYMKKFNINEKNVDF